MDNQIRYLQENLCSIRKIAGWTAEQLGTKIGVTKQTISNLETGKSSMTKTQYIAIRTVLDYEVDKSSDNTVLAQVISMLVDNGEELDEKNYNEIKDAVETTAASATTGKKGDVLNKTFLSLLSNPVIVAELVTVGIALMSATGGLKAITKNTNNWLNKIIK